MQVPTVRKHALDAIGADTQAAIQGGAPLAHRGRNTVSPYLSEHFALHHHGIPNSTQNKTFHKMSQKQLGFTSDRLITEAEVELICVYVYSMFRDFVFLNRV